jgi:fructose-bisphosphate aldolase/2-amino-3,7-dideoxy-D-threo-hept-6-ulosonate synthase
MAEHSTQSKLPGHRIRLDRIFDPDDGRAVILPFDHGMVMGPLPGIVDLRQTVQAAIEGGVDALLFNPGVARQFADLSGRRAALMVKLTNGASVDTDQVRIGTVEQAIRLGADAVCAEFYVGSPGELDSLRLMSALREESERFGIPLMLHAYVYPAYEEKHGHKAWLHACRIASELGADVIKTAYPGRVEAFAEILASVAIPVVVAGGSAAEFPKLLQDIDDAIQVGAAGVAVGRNAWGAKDPARAIAAIRAVVHDRKNLSDVLSGNGWSTPLAGVVGRAHGS